MSPPDLATRRLLIFVVLLCANNAVTSQTNDTSDQVRRSPVPIYKGPEPWRPLSNAVAFGVKRVGAEDEGQERLNAAPNAPTPTNAESLDEPSESLQKEQQPPQTEANNRKHFKLALHESLRRPLKRLTDRQLALLLKQIRRQRQRQFSRESKETEQQEKELQEGLSRTDMLAQIKELLPQDGQRLLRPKLLTNVNVLPNEWAIYPPPRRPTHRESDADATSATNATQSKGEGVEIDGNLYHLGGGGGDGDENNGTTAATEPTGTAETNPTSPISETLPSETTTVTTDEITTTLPIEMRATIRPPIVQTLELNPLSEVPLETTAKSGDVKLDQTEEEPQLTDITSPNLTPENKSANIFSADDNTTATQPAEVADKTTEAGKVEIVEKTAQTTIVHEPMTEQPNVSGKAEIATQPEGAGQPNENITIEEKNMAKLEAGWKVLEQKFAAEMKQAKKNADVAIAKLQKQRKEAEQRGKEGSNSAVLFSSKTLNVASKSDSDELRGLNITHYVQQERAQIGRLSSALRAIRIRYENVKQHFLKKMRRLGLAHRFQGDTPSAFSSKIAGAPTTFVHGDDQNATEEGHNADNGANLNGTNSEADQASETLTTSAEIQQNPELKHTEETTIVSILSNAEDITNGTTEAPAIDKSRSKSKSKLTLAELAAELEQIEREIEESVAAKKKGVLRGNKKVKQNRARVSSSPSPSNASSSSADSLPISASIGAKLRQKPPNHKTEDNGTTAILEEEDVRQQQNPIGKQIAVQPSQLPPGSNESLRRRILTTQKTSKSVLVDTSTEKSEDEPHHEVAQQHNKVAQKHRSEGHMGKAQQQQHRERTKLNQEVGIAATRGGLTEQQATGFSRQPLQQNQQLNGQFDQNAQSQQQFATSQLQQQRQFDQNAQPKFQQSQHVAQQQVLPQNGPQSQNFHAIQQAQQFGAQQQHVQPQHQQTPQQPNQQQQNFQAQSQQQQQHFQAQRQQQSTQPVQQQSSFPQQQNDVHPQLHPQQQQSFITQQPQFPQQSFQPIQQQHTQPQQFQQQPQFQQQFRTQHPQQLQQQQQHPPVSQLSQPFQPQQQQQHFQQVPQQQQSLQSPQLINSQHQQQVPQHRGQLGRANVYNPHSTTAHTTTRGFYQLEHAQVTNVSPKSPLLPSTNLPKLKGVSQVEVAQSVDATPELSTMELSNELRKEMRNQQKQKHKGNNNNNAKQNAKNAEVTPKSKLEDEDLENLEEFARIDEQAICDAIACNFETGSLCDWETSIDELKPNDPRFHRYMLARTYHRHKRQQADDEATNGTVPSKEDMVDTTNVTVPRQENDEVDMKNSTVTSPDKTKQEGGGRVVVRSWHNWVGRYRNRLTGISRAEVFSTRNQRFAATYVKPGQHSMLSGRLLSGEKATIRFRAWEATRDIQLRICCDRIDRDEKCAFETELGVKRGSRKWRDHLATCPQGTKKIIFECRNVGQYQGACGVDNIQLVNEYCPSVTPMKANRQ